MDTVTAAKAKGKKTKVMATVMGMVGTAKGMSNPVF
jgi:hypothetical protein